MCLQWSLSHPKVKAKDQGWSCPDFSYFSSLLFHSFCPVISNHCALNLSCFILHFISQLWLVNIGKWYPNFQNSSWPKQGHTSAVLSVLISIFPSKGPHVVPTGSCCRLWIRRSPSLRNASSSPKNTPEPKAVSHSALYSTQVPHQITVTFIHCPFPSNLRVDQSPAVSSEG